MASVINFGIGTGVDDGAQKVTGEKNTFSSEEILWAAHKWEGVINGSEFNISVWLQDENTGNFQKKAERKLGLNNGDGTYWQKESFKFTGGTGDQKGKVFFALSGSTTKTIAFTIIGTPAPEPTPTPEPEPEPTIEGVITLPDGTVVVGRDGDSFTALNKEQETMLKDFLGIDPPGPTLDEFIARLTFAQLVSWQDFWVREWSRVRRFDLVEFTQRKRQEQTTDPVADLIGEEAPIADIITPEGGLIDSLSQQEKDMFANLVALAGGGGVALAGAGAIGLIGDLQLIGALGSGASGAIKAASALMGVDTLAVWLASDNILSGLAFTSKKLNFSFKAKIITKTEIDTEINKIQGWMDAATKVIEVSTQVNPLLIPFGKLFLINAEKAQLDLDIEKALIEDEHKKQLETKA